MIPDAFFVADGDNWQPTEHTRGPWSIEHQHGGPPSALVARDIEKAVSDDGFRVSRLTCDIVRPVPIAPLRVVTVVGGGRNVRVVDAELYAGDRLLMRARATAIRELEIPDVTPTTSEPAAFAPEDVEDFVFPFFVAEVGYQAAMNLKIAPEEFYAGPLQAWLRMRIPLVLGEEPAPLVRTVIAADSGNGVSPVLDWRKISFINPDLTVHVHRPLIGEWICLDARTDVNPNGIGLASAILRDRHGAFGRSAQSLLLRER